MTQQIAWILVSLAVSIALTTLFGIWTGQPLYGLIPAFGIFIFMSYYMRKRAMARMGLGGGGGGFGGMLGGGGGGINYVCISCGNRYKGASCPRCGSKMKRADFG